MAYSDPKQCAAMMENNETSQYNQCLQEAETCSGGEMYAF
jgi:hypothetical protein